MTEGTGGFIWYELMTTDPASAAAFYGSVIGWSLPSTADPAASGIDYRMIGRSDGGHAGGVLALTPEMTAHGARTTWLGYLHVRDVDATSTAIVADGGTLLMPAFDLPVGRIALVTDPLGVPFYVMAPVPPASKPNQASDVFDPIAVQRVRWNELASRDLVRAKAFYARHVGFRFGEVMPMGEMGDYCFIALGAHARIGGLMQRPDGAPEIGWLFYFGVPSVRRAHEAIVRGGGTVIRGPHAIPGGEWVVIATDPQGAPFGVVGPEGG